MNLPMRRAMWAALLMVAAASVAHWFTPTQRLAALRRPPVVLDRALPKQFGDWSADERTATVVVNPQQLDMINKLYSQTLSRTYTDSQGRSVMLSIAYGEDQRDGLVVHHPEICYPAQGFDVLSNHEGTLSTPLGSIVVRKLETSAAKGRRLEPVTYWTTVGDKVTLGGTSKKLAEMHYSLRDQIPDGLLFRVSSIGENSAEQFALQQRFVVDLLPHLDAPVRHYLTGLP